LLVKDTLSRDANDTTSRTKARIARLLALLVVAPAQIISAAVHNHSAANHAIRPDQFDQAIRDGSVDVALTVCLEVAEIADVTLIVGGSAVGLVVGVEMRSSARAAIGVVAEGMDVNAALSVGVIAGDVEGDGGLVALRSLLEGDSALDGRVSSDNGDGFNHCGGTGSMSLGLVCDDVGHFESRGVRG